MARDWSTIPPDTANNIKVTGAAILSTTAGIGTILNYLSNIVGLIASIAGLVLVFYMIRHKRLESSKLRMEIQAFEKHQAEIEERKQAGEPLRRKDDTD